MSTETEKFPDGPPEECQYCIGDSAVRKKDGTLMTSQEWCREMKVCAATIDWDALAEKRKYGY